MSMQPISVFGPHTIRIGGQAVTPGNSACRRCGARFYAQATSFGPRRVLCPPCQRALNVQLTVRPEADESKAVPV